jgi:hypothetical protein
MSEAVELFKKDGNPAGVFYCSECRAVFASQEQAANCHGERMCACGKKIEVRYHSECSECWLKKSRAEEAKREAERFEKAAKIPASEYKGAMVYDNDKFYEEIEDAIDGYLEGQEPEYVWACKDVGIPQATTESLYENILENMWEDADVDDLNGVDELEKAVAAFNSANALIHVYQPDYTTAILVGVVDAPSH